MFKTPTARHRALQPLEDMEVALVRSCIDCPGWLTGWEEAGLRFALSLSHLTEVRTSDGRDIELSALTHPLRMRLNETLSPLLLDHRGIVQRPEIASLIPIILDLTREHAERIKWETRDLLAWSDIEAEIRNKSLVLACGGGGGTGYVYLGAFQAMQERGVAPSLISGTSIGAVLGAFRARQPEFDVADVPKILGELSFGLMFRPMSIRSRYGLPAPLRLLLRKGIGRHFLNPDGSFMRLEDLPLPLLVATAGLRQGEELQEPAWHEHRLDLEAAAAAMEGDPKQGIRWTRSIMTSLWRTVFELARRQEALKSVILGADPVTRSYDLIDAVGFSAAVPGVIQYDLAPEDRRMARLLDDLFERQRLRRLLDGALVDNVPAKAAWRAVQSGRLGKRNALVVALDSFAPKLKQPLWLPIQRLARPNVLRNLKYAHVAKTFTRTLSPVDLVPSPEQVSKAVQWGREEFAHEMPLIERLLSPIPAMELTLGKRSA